MTYELLPQPGDTALTAQLFRYAQDMDSLMRQHNRLQMHHQQLMQSLGREVHGDDLLPKLLARVATLYWVCDESGAILQTGAQNAQAWARHPGLRTGQNVEHLLAPDDRQMVHGLLQQFADRGVNACAVELRLRLLSPDTLRPSVELDGLLMPVLQGGLMAVHWFMGPAPTQAYEPLHLQRELVRLVQSEHGVSVVLPDGDFAALNSAYGRINGYAESELLGWNPRILSSGRHSAGFFQDFWLELLDSGHWSGSIFNRRKAGDIFLGWKNIRMVVDKDGKVVSYMEALVDMTYAEPSVKRLEAMANTDPLTGLSNRRMLMQQLSQFLAEAEQDHDTLALLFIDLDRFKPINDELGHAMGDLVLQEVARRMHQTLLPCDLLARVGGDEFVVVLRGNRRVDMAEAIGAHIQDALKPPLLIHNCHLAIGASIGCARYPLDASELANLMKYADAAMYGAKRFGIPFIFYDVGLSEGVHHNLEFDLWQALERQEISLVYQPQISSLRTPSLRGCEALMRWNHPTLGEIDPALFIDLAERSGAMVPLGSWALSHACEQLRKWREQGLPEFTLSLNLSLRQLRHPHFLGEVCKALEDNDLEPEMLELELSETQAMLFVSSDAAHIQALREVGVRIAIDDYGISFSSLSRLNFLSISSFKISAQCVRELSTSEDARAISNCMIAISKAMGIEVIAQGVETREQAQLLAQQGCHVIQGFYSGHPLSAEGLHDMLQPGRTATR